MAKIDYTVYFSDPTVTEIYVTEDNQIFYPSGISYLNFHCRKNKVKYSTITRTEAFKAKEKEEKKQAEAKAKEAKEKVEIPKDKIKVKK